VENMAFQRFLAGIVCLACMALAVRADFVPLPIYPIGGSIAPYVDKDGYVNPIVSLGDIDFGNGLKLPLVLNFSSAIRPPSPEFGQGWECPLFQSKIFDAQPNLKRMETLGGKYLYFVYNPRTESWKHFFTDDWKGVAKGDDFELTYKDSYKLVFNRGLINSLTTPDNRTIVWNRTGNKLISLQEMGKPPALIISYDPLGFAKQILLNPDNKNVVKGVYNFSSSLVYAGIEKIQCPGNNDVSFVQSRDKSGTFMANWTDPTHAPMSLAWDSKTGKIQSDGKYTYQINEVSGDLTWPHMERTNIETRKAESYYFDQAHGTTDETLADGTVRHIEMIQAPGPNYKAIRLIQDTKDGTTRLVLRHAFDENGHVLQEAIGLAQGKEQIRQFTYDSAGRPISYFFDGKEMWRNSYNSTTGQLREHILPQLKVSVLFDALPNGEVKEIVKGSNSVETSWARTEASLSTISN
jgi:hypothetical protein